MGLDNALADREAEARVAVGVCGAAFSTRLPNKRMSSCSLPQTLRVGSETQTRTGAQDVPTADSAACLRPFHPFYIYLEQAEKRAITVSR